MIYRPKHILTIFALFLTLLISSCAGTKNIQSHIEMSACTQQGNFPYSPGDIPRPFHQIDLDTALSARFSPTSLNVANAIGILDLLTNYVNGLKKYQSEQTIDNRLSLLELSHKISQRINLASLEVSSVASELDCEEEKIAQLANYLNEREGENETRLTVMAIVAGATGAIVSGILLSNGKGGDNIEYIGIASGITEATLGLMILSNKRKAEFYHPRNALREVWEGRETSQIFPSFVWYYLNYHNPDNPDNKSLRYQILERWMSFKQIDNAKSKRKRQLIDLYFGDGGKYTTEQLYNRANMYDQLESYIKLIKQDLTLLSVEFENIK